VEHGQVIAASHLGKYKTITTMLAIMMFLFNDFGLTLIHQNLEWVANSMYYLAILFTVWSGFDYLYKNRKIIFESM
ncbi:MAG TPA: CDP-diacylglycerol--glycerol-3-phosphate 3-phosphatidyltransferase, partial [Acholeplasmataceae bacterium]|nr:CDP-diacylglycerol--glycerol-3-phosphate 3-phosphatidyltransferase [Acholeplasmataceae bacterium]